MIQTIDPAEREERNLGMLAHLSALLAGFIVPFGHIIGPLVIYLTNKDKRPFATEHAKASLNFQITLSIVVLVMLVVFGLAWLGIIGTAIAQSGSDANPQFPMAGIALVVSIGGFLLIGGVLSLIWTIMGAVAASQGRTYRYPVSMYFVK